MTLPSAFNALITPLAAPSAAAGTAYAATGFGALGDTRQITATVSTAAGSAALVAIGANFTNADIGKVISIGGAVSGSHSLGAAITAVADANHCTLSANATATLSSSSQTVTIGTDDTVALQTAISASAGRVLSLCGLIYTTTTCLLVPSSVTIDGGTIIPSALFTLGSITANGAVFRNQNFATSTALQDHDIRVQNVTFDFRVRDTIAPPGQAVGVFMRYVNRVDVEQCVQFGGQDFTAMLGCADTAIRFNRAYECKNCPYDHWNSATSAVVIGNFQQSLVTPPHQAIQFTADNTDPITGALTSGGASARVVIQGNIVLWSGSPVTNKAGIILNCLSLATSIQDAIVTGNYVNGPDFGIAVQGAVSNFTINDNIIRNAGTQGILFVSGASPSLFAKNGTVSNNTLVSCGAIGIDLQFATGVVIAGNRITGSTTESIRLLSGVSSCVVEGNLADTGSLTDIQNLGTDNTIIRPIPAPKFNGSAVFHGAAPTSFTTLDLGAITFGHRALVTLYVLNSSGSTATYAFYDKGQAFGDVNALSTGANTCTIRGSAMGMITAMTDATGKLQWASTIGTGIADVFLEAWVSLS